jgi:tetratricopeptide (TPR) repeat protein
VTAQVRQLLHQAAASGDAAAMLSAGAAALSTGADADALGPVEAMIRDGADHPNLWQLLGLLHRNLEDQARAVEAFARAAALAPDDAMIVHGHACVRHEAGLPAARLFEQAMRLDPADRSILLRHAAAEIAEGRRAAAIAGLEAEARRNPLWVEGHKALARLRWAAGERDDFAASFERAVAAAPRAAALWHAYAETLLDDELHERALAVIARARAAAGPHRALDLAEAIARSERGELAAAGALFRRLAPLADVTSIVACLRFLLRAGDAKQAAQIAAQSAPNDPSHQIWPYLSIAWRLTGDSRWEWLEGDPRFIGVYDIADRMPPLDLLAAHLRGLHRTHHRPLHQSLRGGTQTEGHLFQRIDPQIRMLRQAVAEAVETHVAQLPPPRAGHPLLIERRAPIGFSGAWSVRLSGGGRHVDHVHLGAWFSSALYIALPAAAEAGGGEAGWLSLGEAGAVGVDLPPIRLIEPRPGRLVLFPSTMWHGTRPFGAGERLTVAFDVKRPG